MMYDKFVRRCKDRGIAEPTYDEYSNIIEPVYNYHPVFDGNFAEDRCAEIYKIGGLGVFLAMREDADAAKELELECQKMQNKFGEAIRNAEIKLRELVDAKNAEDEACRLMREANEEMRAFRESVRNLWRCA